MSRAEDRLNGSIDRQREKVAGSARALQLRETAMATINCAVMELQADDRPEFMRGAVKRLRQMYAAATNEQSAVALFGSMAWSPTLQTARVIADARAEQLFSTLAANDPEGE